MALEKTIYNNTKSSHFTLHQTIPRFVFLIVLTFWIRVHHSGEPVINSVSLLDIARCYHNYHNKECTNSAYTDSPKHFVTRFMITDKIWTTPTARLCSLSSRYGQVLHLVGQLIRCSSQREQYIMWLIMGGSDDVELSSWQPRSRRRNVIH